MMFKLVVVTAVLSTSAGMAHGQSKVDIRAGRHLAEIYCASCHATGPIGASPRSEAPPFRTLSQHYPVDALEEALGEGILVGHSNMPQVVFSQRGVVELIAYLKSVQTTRPQVLR